MPKGQKFNETTKMHSAAKKNVSIERILAVAKEDL